MQIKPGDTIPAFTLRTPGPDGKPQEITTDQIFKGKKVVMFAVPGAYTPTCSAKHLPGYVAKAPELKNKGVDTVVCLSVNDAFVLDAWAKEQKSDGKVMMLADGSGDFTRRLGMDVDLSAFGMGVRSARFALVAEDGKVTAVKREANPGALEVCSADNMLDIL